MSDFVVGFASRHSIAGELLRDAFSRPEPGFAARDLTPAPPPGPGPATGPRSFRPADPGHDPTAGWDPFDASVPAQTPFVDPIATAYAAGVEEGRTTALTDIGRERVLIERLAATLRDEDRIDREQLARHLRTTVLHLVAQMIGETPIPDLLFDRRIAAATACLADASESAMLRVHPDDLERLTQRLPGNVFPVADVTLQRGAFVLEAASTLVEDGPDLWIEQLALAIDRVGMPPC